MSIIFLAGTMHGDWTDKVKSAFTTSSPHFFSQYYFYNPKDHGLEDPKNYTRWDLGMISRSDLVFAYMDAGNPSGAGLALEVGYAKGIGVPVVLVLEDGVKKYRYFEIVKHSSDFCFDTLDEGIAFLKKHNPRFLAWGKKPCS